MKCVLIMAFFALILNFSYSETPRKAPEGYGMISWYDSQEAAREKIKRVGTIISEEKGKIVASWVFNGRKCTIQLGFSTNRFSSVILEYVCTPSNAYIDYIYFSNELIKKYGLPDNASSMYNINITNCKEDTFIQYINQNILWYQMGWDFNNNCTILFNIWQKDKNIIIRYWFSKTELLIDDANKATEDIKRMSP